MLRPDIDLHVSKSANRLHDTEAIEAESEMGGVGAKPESAFLAGGIRHVFCVRLQVPGFGSRYVPYLQEDGSDQYLGVARARAGLRSYSDFGRMIDWLDRRYGYQDKICVVQPGHADISRLGLVMP